MISEYEQQMLMGKIRRESSSYRKSLAFARVGITSMLEAAPKSYVSISFGKQSLVVAHLVWEIAPETPMHFLASDETWSLYNYAEVIDDFLERFPINLTIHQTRLWKESKSWKEARDAGDQDLQRMCPRKEWDGWFWGLTKEESPMRKKTLLAAYEQRTPHPSIFRYSDGKLRCCPIMHWDTIDIAAYLGQHDIRVLNIYERYGLHQRTTARITKKMLRNQGMALARMTNSAGYRQLVSKFPEINIQ